MQLKEINQRIVHCHSPFYVKRHSIPTPLKQIFQSYIPRSLVGGWRHAARAQLTQYCILLAASGRTWLQSYMMRMHALLPPLLLQVLCWMLCTGVAKGNTRGRGHAPCWSKKGRVGNWYMHATYITYPYIMAFNVQKLPFSAPPPPRWQILATQLSLV